MERWGRKKRRKRDEEKLQRRRTGTADHSQRRAKQPENRDTAEEADARQKRAGTEWRANQPDPAVAMNPQAGQALDIANGFEDTGSTSTDFLPKAEKELPGPLVNGPYVRNGKPHGRVG